MSVFFICVHKLSKNSKKQLKGSGVHIHPTALIDAKAKLGERVVIGPYCVIGPEVTLEDDVRLHSHVVIEGKTWLSRGCVVFPFASLGHAPQDLKYSGEPSTVWVGEQTVIREYVTIQPGTKDGIMQTKVGVSCLLMASAHVAHDCVVGNGVIMANQATLGGHVIVEDGVVIGGLAAIHQFVRLGTGSMIAGLSGIVGDVIPYGMTASGYNRLVGLNLTGLKRAGVKMDNLRQLQDIYHMLFESQAGSFEERFKRVQKADNLSDESQKMLAFIATNRKRSLCLPR